jgi:hypothetical protein
VAKLTTAKRKRLRKTTFGIPSKRAYPMPDASHAKNAKARAKQQLKKGRISKSTYSRIVAKANKKLRGKKAK